MDRRQRLLLAAVIIALVVCLAVGLVLTLRVDPARNDGDDDTDRSGRRRPVTTEVEAHRGQHAAREVGVTA
jgi:hypothetical protein